MKTTDREQDSHRQNGVVAEVEPEKKSDRVASIDVVQSAPGFEHITGVNFWAVLISITLTVFIMMLDKAIIVTAIPKITSDFHALSDVGWYGNAYLLSICALQPLAGKIYSQFSSKHSFLCFLAVFEIGSITCGAARSSAMLIVGRAVAGMGASGICNGAFTIIGAAVPAERQPAILGIVISLSQIGIVIAPLVGGVLTQYSTWRWCFYLNLPVGGMAALLIFLMKMPDRVAHVNNSRLTILSLMKRIDMVGFLMFAPAAVMLLMALQWGGTEYSWNSATTVGLFCGGGIILIPFVVWEYYAADDAMFPVSVIYHRVVSSSCIYGALFLGAVMIFTYYMPIYFQAVRGVSPSLSGVYMLPSIIRQMIAAGLSGIIAGKLRYCYPFSMSSGILVAIGGGLLATLNLRTPTSKWIGYQILLGVGRGFGIQMPIIAVQNILPSRQSPIVLLEIFKIFQGIGLVVFSQTLGGSIFLAFAKMIFSHSLATGLARYAPTVDVQLVEKTGATAIRHAVDSQYLPGVLEAYQQGINDNFYLVAAFSATTIFLAFGTGFDRIKKEDECEAGEQA